jgi:hypothetical protein
MSDGQDMMDRRSPSPVGAVSALAMALLLPGVAVAAPKRLDCSLTKVETRTGANFEVGRENRPVTVVFDAEAKSLAVYQDGGKRALGHVTITQISMNGYIDEMSLGIDMSSWSVVLQLYKPEAMTTEFGACSQSAKPPP